jgi:hypothetical protein
MPEGGLPGGKGLLEGHHHRLRVRRFHLLQFVVREGGGDGVLGAHRHLVGEDEVLRGDGRPVGPDNIVPQFQGDDPTVRGDAAVLLAGHFLDQDRMGVVLVVKVPGPAVPDLLGDGGEPHVGVEGIEDIGFLGPDEGGCFSRACGRLHDASSARMTPVASRMWSVRPFLSLVVMKVVTIEANGENRG